MITFQYIIQSKMRTIIDLPEKHIQFLKQLGDIRHLSRAELVRRAVEEYLSRHAISNDDAAFGLWRERNVDGLQYQQNIRDEWDK